MAPFTLIEFLVIIVILATLGHGREQTNRTACMSNLRKLHSLVSRFSSDNGGALPVGYQLGQKQFNTTLYSASVNQYVLIGKLLANGSVQNPRVFFCPSERDTTRAYNTKANPYPVRGGTNLQGGHATNPLVDWGSADFPSNPIRLTNIGRVPLMADGVGMPKQVDSRHTDGINVFFSDGSGCWVSREKFATDLSAGSSISASNNAMMNRI